MPSANQVRERLAGVAPEVRERLSIDFLVAGILAGDIKIVTLANPFPEVGGEFISVVVPKTAVWP